MKRKTITIRFETNLNASMKMKVFDTSRDKMIKQILKQFPDAFNIDI